MPASSNSVVTPVQPSRVPPGEQYPHFELWDRVNDLIYSLPNYFETDLVVKGINVTEIFSIGGAFSTVVDTQVVNILNRLRSVWDPDNEHSNYAFFRQSQTFPDVLLRSVTDEWDILFGIELKSWYVLSKEGEPSFRYKIDPDACAPADLLVVIPWLLSEVISGTPTLLTPYKELAKYAAEYRNYYWQEARIGSDYDPAIRRPPEEYRHSYPDSKQEASDEAEDDKGGNFGRIARAGILDKYIAGIKVQDYLGVKLDHWIKFFKAISETSTDIQVDRRIQLLKAQIQEEFTSLDSEQVEYRAVFLKVVERLEELWEKMP
jgi:hypothetical protein